MKPKPRLGFFLQKEIVRCDGGKERIEWNFIPKVTILAGRSMCNPAHRIKKIGEK